MKKNSIIFTAIAALLYVTLSSDIDGAAHHGHGNITGSLTGRPGTCQTSSCHGTNNTRTVVQLQVLDTSTMTPITTYNALQTYLVTITGDATAVSTTLPGFGFMASAVLGNHTQAGTYTIPSALSAKIHTYPCGATTVVEHSVVLSPITTGVNKYSIQFYWTAPPPASDSVSFFSVLNAVNGNADKTGDYPDAAPIVTIYEDASTATCGIPTGLADSAVTDTTLFLYWSAVTGAVSYKIQYRPVGSSTWTTTTSTTTSKKLTGLLPSTTYEFGVQTVCSGSPSLYTPINDTATTDTSTIIAVNAVHEVFTTGSCFTIYPNPASGNPTVSYNLSSPAQVTISAFDIFGRMAVKIVDHEFQINGAHQYQPAFPVKGLYLVKFESGNTSVTYHFIKQ